MSGTLSYVFCLVRTARRPTVRKALPGMPGGTGLRTLAGAEGVWAIVETVPAAAYAEAALAAGLQDLDWVGVRAMAHERVIEHFLSAPALLPMQLFTLFKSDERVIEHVHGDRRRLDRIFDRLEGKVEWGLRLTWDEKTARDTVERKHARAAGSPEGKAYLARKRDMLAVNRAQFTAAREQAGRVYSKVARDADAAIRRTSMEAAAPGSRLLLDAAFLVPSARGAAFRAALRQHTRELRGSGIAVALTGPWPAYNFITPPSQQTTASRGAR